MGIAESVEQRNGELARAVMVLLNDAPDGLPIKEVIDRVAVLVPPTTREWHSPPSAAGLPAYEQSVRRSSMELAKAGWLTKSAGTWQITGKGRSALDEFPDPVAFYQAALRRRDPTVTAAPSEAVGDMFASDIFAGGFLSIAGSLVGAIIGTIVLLVRMLPDPSLALVVGFGAAFVVGAVLGFLAMFGMAGIAGHFGRHAEDVWVSGTALVAATSAALTPSLLIAVDTGSASR